MPDEKTKEELEAEAQFNLARLQAAHQMMWPDATAPSLEEPKPEEPRVFAKWISPLARQVWGGGKH